MILLSTYRAACIEAVSRIRSIVQEISARSVATTCELIGTCALERVAASIGTIKGQY
ncbi:MAG: hypothetical protein AVDCRST_MAG93-1903, partial [uncultured Chloroflexia bacterium]